MSLAADEFSWLDEDTSWLDKEPEVKVEAANKIDCESLRGRAMYTAVKNRKRTWACDGQYVFFRRKNCEAVVNGVTVRNDTMLSRHEGYIKNGDYEYIETQDDVEVYRVNPQSPFARQGVYLGELDESSLQRQVVVAACKMDWVLYTDALEELARRVKASWKYPEQGILAWNERLAYIEQLIALRGGPTRNMVAAGMQRVRQARGVGQGRLILLPPR